MDIPIEAMDPMKSLAERFDRYFSGSANCSGGDCSIMLISFIDRALVDTDMDVEAMENAPSDSIRFIFIFTS